MKQLAILLFIFSIIAYVSATNTTNTTTVDCSNNTLYCVKLNAKCSADQWYTNKSLCSTPALLNASSDPICCPVTQYCVNGTCMDNNIGTQCTSANLKTECFGTINTGYEALMGCVGGWCQAWYGAGDTCTTNSSCYTDSVVSLTCLNTSKCSGAPLNANCTVLFNTGVSTCEWGLYCAPNASNPFYGTCQYVINGTGACNGSVPCGAGYQCNGAACIAVGTESSSCGNASLGCSGSATCNRDTGACESLTAYKPTTCSSDSDCSSVQNGSTCVCHPNGKGYCTNSNAAIDSNEEAVNLVKCLQTNQCGYNYQFNYSGTPYSHIDPTVVNPNKYSCAVESCNSDLKKYVSAQACTSAKMAGNCGANSYCSGFPVWAIIVIVVVAVILVLSVVIVVFLVLRKRRDYSSI